MLPTFGVEEEFLLVDHNGHLARQGPSVVNEANDVEGEIQPELNESQVESATKICESPEELLAQLQTLRQELSVTAQGRKLRLLPAGNPLLKEQDLPGITPKQRYQQMAEHFGETAISTAHCGCHVHVAIPDRAAGIAVIDQVRPWLPILLAMSANSPFWQEKDTGYASWRYQQWSQWPSSGPPPRFGSVARYDDTVERLLRTEAALDRNMIHWDIRLSNNQPTVEFRVADVAATPEEATLLAVLIRGLVTMALNEPTTPAPDLPNAVLKAYLWRAARDGFTGQCPHPLSGDLVPAKELASELLNFVAPALKSGTSDVDFAQEQLAELQENGGAAHRQRALYEQRRNFNDVINMLVEN